jgi:hypothetical protein
VLNEPYYLPEVSERARETGIALEYLLGVPTKPKKKKKKLLTPKESSLPTPTLPLGIFDFFPFCFLLQPHPLISRDLKKLYIFPFFSFDERGGEALLL